MTATGKKSISKASHVVRSRQRLEKAVEGLEQAISKMTYTSSAPDPVLALELKDLKVENAGLRQTNRTVCGRLDDTIGKLKVVLDG